jgi:hypothetical protein
MSKELADKIKEALGIRLQKCELTNLEMVEIIEQVGCYLNLRTVSDYAKFNNITYNGALQRIENKKVSTIELFNVKFIIDNE